MVLRRILASASTIVMIGLAALFTSDEDGGTMVVSFRVAEVLFGVTQNSVSWARLDWMIGLEALFTSDLRRGWWHDGGRC